MNGKISLNINLGSAQFTQSAGGIYYAGPYPLTTVGIMLSYVNTGVIGLSNTYSIFLQAGSSGVYVFSNTDTFASSASATFRIFGLTSALS